MESITRRAVFYPESDRSSRCFYRALSSDTVNLRSVAQFLGAEGDTLGYVMEYVGGVSPFAVFFICSYNMEILVKN